MTFLVILVGLLFVRLGGSLRTLHHDGWYSAWYRQLQRRLGTKTMTPAILLSILLPVLLVALLASRLNGFWYFLLAILVFLYSLGRSNLREQVETYRNQLRRDNLQAAFHAQQQFNLGGMGSTADDWQELHAQGIAAISYRYFERFFAVIFWFALAGPAGALLYRLVQLRVDLRLESGDTLAERSLWLLEWVPVRLYGLILPLVGDFVGAFRPWLDTLFAVRLTSAELLGLYSVGAMSLGDNADKAEEIYALQRLIYRSLVAVLVLLALWSIL